MKRRTFCLALVCALACFSSLRSSAGWFPAVNVGDQTFEKLNETLKQGIDGLKEVARSFGDQGPRTVKCVFIAGIGATLAIEGLWLIHKTLNPDEKVENQQLQQNSQSTLRQEKSRWVKPTIGALLIATGLMFITHSASN